MSQLAIPSKIKNIMNQYNFRCTKSLGQNFLADPNIIQKIVQAGDLKKTDRVLEIGPGLGVLTQQIAKEVDKVVALEKDAKLLPILEETLADLDNVEVFLGDALKVDFDALVLDNDFSKSYKIIANLPYYITTPLLFKLMENNFTWEKMIIMIQKEVATRLSASPGTKDYGSLTLTINYYAKVEYLFKVPSNVFIPKPAVDSAVISLSKRDKPAVLVPDEEFFFKVIRASFGQRRKTLLNCLTSSFSHLGNKEELTKIIESAGINPSCRGETLRIEEFSTLSYKLYEKQQNNSD